MTRAGSVVLDANDQCPRFELKLISGESLRLPEATGGGYGVVLFYRGHW